MLTWASGRSVRKVGTADPLRSVLDVLNCPAIIGGLRVTGSLGLALSAQLRHRSIFPAAARGPDKLLSDRMPRKVRRPARDSAAQRLADNEKRYSAIVNGALDAIVAIDEDGCV